MPNLNCADAIRHVVEAMLPKFSSKEISLLITLDFRYSVYGKGKVKYKRTSAELCLLFNRPSHYTKVLTLQVKKGDDWKGEPFGKHEWKMTSDHDSCWRSDGLRCIHETEAELIEKLGNPEYKDVSRYINYSICNPIKYVKTSFEKLENVSYCQRWMVDVGETIPIQNVHKYVQKLK